MKIAISVIIVAVLFALGWYAFSGRQTDRAPASQSIGAFLFEQTEHDFGIVKQSGGVVSHAFAFVYMGKEERAVVGVPTSCGCTTATISTNVLKPGASGVITVSFDPNLHAEPEGKFFKTISILTDPPLETDQELKIWAQIDLDLGVEAYKEAGHDDDHDDAQSHTQGKPFHTITASTLDQWMKRKDFFLVDVHIPEQEHIPGTDAVIAFDALEDHISELPANKDQRVVLYCRSGSMSQQAATTLHEMGYTNVYHLEGGLSGYNEFIGNN